MNEEIDAKIVDAVKEGKNQFCQLNAVFGFSNFRKLDRRLQALRKRGVLKYDRKAGWQVAN